jgi:hypothetical protein
VKVQIVGGSMTTVSFTNRSTLALLRVCKAVGGGVNPGTVFQFTAGGINLPSGPEPTSASLSVPAGECREAAVLEGLYDVIEFPAAGFAVSAIACLPVENCPDISVQVGVAKARMVGGSTTEVRFTNMVTAQ